MICQIVRMINSFVEDFWGISLEELHGRLVSSVRGRTTRFYIPSFKRYCKGGEYTLWGTYTRERIIDMQRIPCEEGGYRYEEVIITKYPIQRIRDNETGATHAVLSELFIPFKQYTMRYILFHLQQFFNQHVTLESYCLDAEIEPKTFGLWIKWLKDHISILQEVGLTECYLDNWKAMKQWIQKIAKDISKHTYNSLRKLNLALFQKREMPENTKYQNWERSR